MPFLSVLNWNGGYLRYLQVVTPETAQILYDDTLDLAILDVSKHPPEAWTVAVAPEITVVFIIMAESGNPIISAIPFPKQEP